MNIFTGQKRRESRDATVYRQSARTSFPVIFRRRREQNRHRQRSRPAYTRSVCIAVA